MKLIARNDGPRANGVTTGCLTPKKEYEPLDIFFPNSIYKSELKEVWINKKLTYNPRKALFYIKVLDDNNRYQDIWNDYFLSTEEIRQMNLNILLP